MKKAARNSIIYMAGMIIIAIISFFNTIILTRILPGQVFAQYGLLTTFTTASITVISLGMDAAYTRFFYESGYSASRYLLKSFTIPFFVLIIFMLLLLEPNHRLLNYVFEDGITKQFIWLFVGYILFSLFGKFTQLTARMGEFAINYVLSNLIAKAGFVVIIFIVCWVISDVTLSWVVFSFTVASALAMFINISTLYKVKTIRISEHKRVTTTEMLKYGMPFMLSNVMMLIIPLIERLIVRELAGWEVLSIYTAASVFYTVIALMKNTIDNIWNPIVFQYYKNEELFKPLLHDFGLAITWITVMGLGLCIFLRRWLVLILDSRYFDVYLIAPAIMYTACFEIYTLIYSVGINTAKKTVHVICASLIQIIISVALCYLLIPKTGLIGAGIASLFSIIISRIYKIVLGLYYYGTGRREWKTSLLWLMGAVASVIVMFSTTVVSDVFVFIALGVVCFIVINREGIILLKRMGDLFIAK